MSETRTLDENGYRTRALAACRVATNALAALGVRTLVTGSLARGQFGPHSDVDFLITTCPRHLKYAIEGIIEDIMDEIPFDTIYVDDIPAVRVERFCTGAVNATDIE